MMESYLWLNTETYLFGLILLAGFYMAWNIGANDVANAMGTSVGSGALTLRRAVLLAAVLEFSGAFFFGSHVSETMQKGIVDSALFMDKPEILVYGMLASLLAAGIWLQMASYLGLPVSTTHTIVGAIVGFGAIIGGLEAIYWQNVAFIVTSWILSPLAGGAFAYYLFTLLRRYIFYSFHPVQEAKRLTPFLAFFVITILALILVYNGLANLKLELHFLTTLCISMAIGGVGSVISYFWTRNIGVNAAALIKRPPYGSDVAISLEKAKKHLERVKASAVGDLNYHVTNMLDELDALSSSLKQNIEQQVTRSEYATVEKIFGYLQILSASLMAFAHGANDVANAIGPLSAAITILLSGTVVLQAAVPTWALALGGAGIIIGLGTWGWRVINTIGKKITELTPTRGFAAEFGAATAILIATRFGMPISTTHTLVGAVIGVGLARGIEALNMATARDIVISWIVTVPAGAVLAVAFFHVIQWAFN